MRFKQILQIICFLFVTNGADGFENIEISTLITDFLLKLNFPINIFAHVCWPEADQIYFWKQMSSNNFTCQVGKLGFSTHRSFSNQHQVFLIDTSCNGTKVILKQAQQLNLFNQPFRWIVWGNTDYRIFKDIYLKTDSQVFIIEKNKNTQYYNIKSIYKHSVGSVNFSWNDLAEWKSDQGFLKYNVLSVYKNRSNLMEMNLDISYVVTNPDTMNHLEDYRYKHIDPISKLNWGIYKNVISMLNATSTGKFTNTWGYKDHNTSKYTGMIGHLTSGEAEIGGTALFFTTDRIDIIDYVAPSVPSYMRFIFRAPSVSYVSNVFTLPFDTYVWYACFMMMPLIFIVVYIIVKWEWKDPIFKEKVSAMETYSVSPLRPGLIDVLVMELGAVTQQGTDTEPKSNAGRIATVFAFIAFMFLYTSYSANIVAILQSTTESIKTLDDLLNSRISLGVEDIVYAHYYFENAEDPVKKAIYHQKIAPKGQKPNFMSIPEGISRVQKEFFAFHVEASNGYQIIANTFHENEKCSLKEIEYINVREPWLCIKKNSAYKKLIKVALRKISETGIERREINKLYTKKPVCHSKASNFGSAGILDCYDAFLLYAVGIIISFLVLFTEKIIHSKLKRPINN